MASAAPGVARIKEEYLLPPAVIPTSAEPPPATANGAHGEPETKKLRVEGDEKPKLSKRQRRGQNKSKDRPRVQKQSNSEKLCPQYADGVQEEGCRRTNCDFMHDVQTYLDKKPASLSSPCPIYAEYGKCPRGLSCVFVGAHISTDGGIPRNLVDEQLWARMSAVYESTHKNILDNETRIRLRSRNYDFAKVEAICNEAVSCVDRKTAGAVTDEDSVRLRVEEIKKFDWSDKLYLSPLTTVGNLPFRRLCVEYGADVTCSEMSLATSLLQGHAHEFGLHRRHPSEKFWGVQLCSNNVYTAAKAAQALIDVGVDYDFVDLNLGCPLDNIYRMGAGSGLMTRGHKKLESFTRGMSTLLASQGKQFTVKMRAGVKTGNYIAHSLIPFFKRGGVSMMTIHGRTREQRYTKTADWSYIKQCSELSSPIPLYGNGDILSWEEYNERKQLSSTTGVMIGRGALMKPWLFTEIKEQRTMDLRSSERLELIRKYCNYGLDHFGSDTQGVETTRRFLLEWLSFLCRYIPVGILETPPQKMNDRPPKYKGRDEMESLLASQSSPDWVKISEMFLGPVPDRFVFLPKHKANSWA